MTYEAELYVIHSEIVIMKTKYIYSIAVLLLFLASCTRYKDIVYLQSIEPVPDSSAFYAYDVPTYKIQQRDILYIRIISMNQEVTEIMNTSQNQGANVYNNEASFYIYGYNVSDSGNVDIPMVGGVHVVGKTLEEAKMAIIQQTEKILKKPTVIVKLISFKYSVLGEVNSPGLFTNFNNQLTVLEAISQAGDISAYGNRRKVMVIRPNVKGTTTFRLDLTSDKILTTEGFFLLPNDIVYVEPVKSRNFRNNTATYSLLLSGITTFILLLNFLK